MAALTEEQSMIKDQAKSWVSEQAAVRKFRELRDSGNKNGFDKAIWLAMVVVYGGRSFYWSWRILVRLVWLFNN